MYKYESSVWIEKDNKSTTTALEDIYLGCSVALSENGTIVVAGGYGYNGDKGGVWVYKFNGTIMEEHGIIDGALNEVNTVIGNAKFGSCVSIGATPYQYDDLQFGKLYMLAIGGPEDNLNKGAVWLYSFDSLNNNITFRYMTKLIGDNYSNEQMFQGFSVCISKDGTTVVVGSTASNNNRGSIYIFKTEFGHTTNDHLGVWNQIGLQVYPTDLLRYNQIGSYFGFGVAISTGEEILASAFYHNNSYGGVWSFVKRA